MQEEKKNVYNVLNNPVLAFLLNTSITAIATKLLYNPKNEYIFGSQHCKKLSETFYQINSYYSYYNIL